MRDVVVSPSMKLVLAVTLLGLPGCFPAGSSSNGASGNYGYSGPTFELTVSGQHFGPTVPAAGSGASLVTQYDASGAVASASFSLNAAISDGSAGCQLAFERYGGALGNFQYNVASQQGATTADGTVYASVPERITLPGDSASCSGSGCDGAGLALTALDAQHVTGYFRGTMQDAAGQGAADVVCSFWLPMLTYQP
jgi:hypothetical protein